MLGLGAWFWGLRIVISGFKKFSRLKKFGLNFESRPNYTIRGTFESPARHGKFLDYFYSQLFDMLHIQKAEKC